MYERAETKENTVVEMSAKGTVKAGRKTADAAIKTARIVKIVEKKHLCTVNTSEKDYLW